MQATEQGIRISADTMIALVVAEAEAREEASLPSLREMNEAFRPSASFGQRMDKLFAASSAGSGCAAGAAGRGGLRFALRC